VTVEPYLILGHSILPSLVFFFALLRTYHLHSTIHKKALLKNAPPYHCSALGAFFLSYHAFKDALVAVRVAAHGDPAYNDEVHTY